MHCYQPRLHIVEGERVDEIVNSEKAHLYLFPATYFFPVTSYMNERVGLQDAPVNCAHPMNIRTYIRNMYACVYCIVSCMENACMSHVCRSLT